MARYKNALTKYYVGDLEEKEANLRLAKWIQTVEDDTDEEVEEEAYYDGDGTPEEDVISVKKKYSFEGFYDNDDPAHRFIADLEFDTGEDRKIWFKQVRTSGEVLEGPATVTEPKVTGGEASEYQHFSFAIAWDRKPDISKSDDDAGGGVEG